MRTRDGGLKILYGKPTLPTHPMPQTLMQDPPSAYSYSVASYHLHLGCLGSACNFMLAEAQGYLKGVVMSQLYVNFVSGSVHVHIAPGFYG